MQHPVNGAPPPPTPQPRLTVSLREDGHALILRAVHPSHQGVLDMAMMLPIETAEALARAILENCSKASKIVIPQTPLG